MTVVDEQKKTTTNHTYNSIKKKSNKKLSLLSGENIICVSCVFVQCSLTWLVVLLNPLNTEVKCVKFFI